MIYYHARAHSRHRVPSQCGVARRCVLVAWWPGNQPLLRAPRPTTQLVEARSSLARRLAAARAAIGGTRRRLATGAFCARRLRRATKLAGAECVFLRVIARQGFQASMGQKQRQAAFMFPCPIYFLMLLLPYGFKTNYGRTHKLLIRWATYKLRSIKLSSSWQTLGSHGNKILGAKNQELSRKMLLSITRLICTLRSDLKDTL